MLRRLVIRDVVLIQALDLSFREGLGVLTGETGAGKSILLDALGLALGGRGGAEVVRVGAAQAMAMAEFEIPETHPVRAWAEEQGYLWEPGEPLILRRVVSAEGRGRAFLNDQPASLAALKAAGSLLVEIHGQFDERGLLNPAGHRRLLDLYAANGPRLTEVRRLWRARSEAEAARSAAEAALTEARREVDFISHALEELDDLAPRPGEEEALDATRRGLRRAEQIAGDVARAAELLGAQGAEGRMAEALRWLEGAAPRAEALLDPALAALDRALAELSEAAREVDRALESLAFDPRRLEEAEERLFALRGLARKHQTQVEDLPKLREALAAKMAFISAGEERLKALDAAAEAARKAYSLAAGELGAARRKAGEALAAAVAEELAPLRMERAQFRVKIDSDPAQAGPEGQDRVSFEAATNPGSRPGPLDKIASGGELARFLLAIKARLADSDDPKTLIFDEIDSGVGGAAADAVGRRLQKIGEAGQALAVTHSPQVAARARDHWRISKRLVETPEGPAARTEVEALTGVARLEELARMLAGETITPQAREAAASLLALAQDKAA
ncbi:DNA repair protein RecN [Neomegalonema sp.]|uniref:DNA repair protein RecN n=1 Tax=Neomegalonema sp. TaxID=2039713 RepID=UPI002602FDC6|nr:DNA repair protein RecN [Neomegalonema sp.]MDD2867047.1 DNA repair protein RecN [Neomegalonema sp.]